LNGAQLGRQPDDVSSVVGVSRRTLANHHRKPLGTAQRGTHAGGSAPRSRMHTPWTRARPIACLDTPCRATTALVMRRPSVGSERADASRPPACPTISGDSSALAVVVVARSLRRVACQQCRWWLARPAPAAAFRHGRHGRRIPACPRGSPIPMAAGVAEVTGTLRAATGPRPWWL